MKNEIRYWMVGATWDGRDPQDARFVENGIWMLGWAQEESKNQFNLAKEMRPGDRIAIKKMKGQGNKDICVRHIGIVKGVVDDVDRVICAVDWIVVDIHRDIASKGCFGSVHGPYTRENTDSDWLDKIFSL